MTTSPNQDITNVPCVLPDAYNQPHNFPVEICLYMQSTKQVDDVSTTLHLRLEEQASSTNSNFRHLRAEFKAEIEQVNKTQVSNSYFSVATMLMVLAISCLIAWRYFKDRSNEQAAEISKHL